MQSDTKLKKKDLPFFEALCGYGWEALRFGLGGGKCSPVPFF